MNQTLAVWLVVGLALITANLPFVVQRPFLVLPWTQAGEPPRPLLAELLLSLIFFSALAALAYYAYFIIGQAFFVPSDAGSTAVFLAKLLAAFGAVALVLSFPGWRNRQHRVQKSFFVRLIELLVFYGFTGALGFALELNMGNRFSQGWEFYAITFSLFVVLGYPGFVYRYLMRHPKPPKAKGAAVSKPLVA